ncbi:MAG: GNVR domain-containing protein [Bacteroidota bacterium]|nr:GNVR domain-containing protein [Bacteroidota bacterium]
MENLRILKPFFRGLPLIILMMIIGVMCAKKYLSYVTPMYESTAKLKLADIGEGIPNGNLFKDFDVFASANKIAAEIEVLKSSELINKALENTSFNIEISRVGAIQSVELFNNSPIQVKILNPDGEVYDRRFKLVIKSLQDYEILDRGGRSIVKGVMNTPHDFIDNKIIVSLNQQVIRSKKNIRIIDTYEFEFLSKQHLFEKVNKNIDIISVDKDVPVIRINYKSSIPEKAALFVNKLAETYIFDYIESKYKAANVTVNFLNKQIEEAGNKLSKSENNIESYRNGNNIVNIRQETETDLRKISQLKIQQTNLKMNLEAIDELNRYINFGKDKFLALAPNFEAFTDLLSTEIVKNIKKLQSDKKDLLLTYTESDERVKVIDSKINDLVSYLIESIKNTKINTQIKYNQITQDINAAEQEFITVPEKEKNMTILTRNFDLLQSSYNFLNEKKIEAEIAQSAKISFHKVITPAIISKSPISPNRPIIIILSAILAMLFSVIAIYTIHLLKAKVNDTVTIEKLTKVPVSISTPFVKNNGEKLFIKNVLQLELKEIIKVGNVLTITTNGKNEGRGFNVIHLCKTLHLQNRNVLLIDVQGDLNSLKTNNKLRNDCYETAWEQIHYYDLSDQDFFYFSNDKLREFVYNLKNEYDLVIINNEYLKEETRALSMMRIADANLFVVDSRTTPLKLISKLELLNAEFQIPNLSFILNRMGYNPNVISDCMKFSKKIIKHFVK